MLRHFFLPVAGYLLLTLLAPKIAENHASIVWLMSGIALLSGSLLLSLLLAPVIWLLTGIGLIVAIRSHRPGETIELTVRRDGSLRTLEITLDAKVG